MELAPGIVVAARYRLERLLGQGGMGAVWAATHTVTRRRIALKILRGQVADRPLLRKRFLREARAATLVDHPNVGRVHDVFELEDGTPVMVLDLLEGETLRARLDRDGVLSVEDACSLLLPVVSAVGSAHAIGVVHRDLKPENVFLTRDDGVKVLDFGIAKLGSDEGATMTAAGTVLGTPWYMSPEQGFGEPDVDHRADIWAIGVMLYEMLSGGRPVEGDNLGQVLRRLMEDGIAPLQAVAPDVPGDLAELASKMLSRDKADRPVNLAPVFEVLAAHATVTAPSFGEVGSEVRDGGDEEPSLDTTLPSGAPAQDTAAPHTLPAEKPGTTRLVALGLSGVAVIALSTLLLSRGGPEKPAGPSSAALPPAAPLPVPSIAPAVSSPEASAPASDAAAPERRAQARRGPDLAGAPSSSSAPVAPAVSVSPPVIDKPKPKQGGLVEEPPF